MNNQLKSSLLNVCTILNQHYVEYLIVGGMAVGLHGYFRGSVSLSGEIADKPDLDFWYNPTYKNYYNLLNALDELGRDVKEYKDETTPTPKTSFFRFEFEDYTLDFLPVLPGISDFPSSYRLKVITVLNGLEIPYIGLQDLLINKESQGRPKDIIDIQELKRTSNFINP